MPYGTYSGEDKPNKGREGGACNRQSCQAEPALYYNHGYYSWYCRDCMVDIGFDRVNKRDWDLNWKPRTGHDQFETREQMDARENAKTDAVTPLSLDKLKHAAEIAKESLRGCTTPLVHYDDFSFSSVIDEAGNPLLNPYLLGDHKKSGQMLSDGSIVVDENRSSLTPADLDSVSDLVTHVRQPFSFGHYEQQLRRVTDRQPQKANSKRTAIVDRAKIKAARKANHQNRKKRRKSGR